MQACSLSSISESQIGEGMDGASQDNEYGYSVSTVLLDCFNKGSSSARSSALSSWSHFMQLFSGGSLSICHPLATQSKTHSTIFVPLSVWMGKE